MPDLSQVTFLGVDGHKLLTIGILFCVFGLIFGLAIYSRLKNLPVHRSMREVSELIYETCKTYLITQGKFLLFLWVFIAVVIVLYFGVLSPVPDKPVAVTLPIILLFSLSGNGRKLRRRVVRDSREHVRQLADGFCRAARQAVSHLSDSAAGRHEHRHDADQRGIADDAFHPALYPRRLLGAMLHRVCHRRIAGRSGAPHRRRHFHQDRRHRLGPDEDRFQNQGRRRAQSGRDRRLHGRQRGRLGRAERRRFRDLRRHRRGADHVHPAGREGSRSCRSNCWSGFS